MLLDENLILEEGLDVLAVSGRRNGPAGSKQSQLSIFSQNFGVGPAAALTFWKMHKNTAKAEASIAPGEITIQQYLIGLNHCFYSRTKSGSPLFNNGISEKYGHIVSRKIGALTTETKQAGKKRKTVEAFDDGGRVSNDLLQAPDGDWVSVNADETDDWIVLGDHEDSHGSDEVNLHALN